MHFYAMLVQIFYDVLIDFLIDVASNWGDHPVLWIVFLKLTADHRTATTTNLCKSFGMLRCVHLFPSSRIHVDIPVIFLASFRNCLGMMQSVSTSAGCGCKAFLGGYVSKLGTQSNYPNPICLTESCSHNVKSWGFEIMILVVRPLLSNRSRAVLFKHLALAFRSGHAMTSSKLAVQPGRVSFKTLCKRMPQSSCRTSSPQKGKEQIQMSTGKRKICHQYVTNFAKTCHRFGQSRHWFLGETVTLWRFFKSLSSIGWLVTTCNCMGKIVVN